MRAACPRLREFLDRHRDTPAVAALAATDWADGEAAAIACYRAALPIAEAWMWRDGIEADALEAYQAMHREMEALLARRETDERHAFIVVIPVADRPGHLELCLESLLAQCRAFQYGGLREGRFVKVRAIVADDSRRQDNRARHAGLARDFSRRGLEVMHFDQPAQRAELRALGERLPVLASIVGDAGTPDFSLKGASRMRNISYLPLRRLAAAETGRLLFFFIDSDQEFRVLGCGVESRRGLLAPSYFHALDRLFSERPISLLTGKVVGDPPVSPAVMAGNFLADVIAFLRRMAALEPTAGCDFHAADDGAGGDAAYHDMADLFGFASARDACDYPCDLSGGHDHRACFARFAERLARFFDGEHPTRVSCYAYQPLDDGVAPARTIYTGNYVMRAQALRYFIPFAGLRLRMAGPTLGRIVRAELGDGFVSANLPLLHKRTLAAVGRSEFRPGVDRRGEGVDLSGEFERQFFGDVMLFSVETLCERGFPREAPDHQAIRALVEETAVRLRGRYAAKQRLVVERIGHLRAEFSTPDAWWHRSGELADAREAFRGFITDMERNFGARSPGFRRIDEPAHRDERLDRIASAIAAYATDRAAWERALASLTVPTRSG